MCERSRERLHAYQSMCDQQLVEPGPHLTKERIKPKKYLLEHFQNMKRAKEFTSEISLSFFPRAFYSLRVIYSLHQLRGQQNFSFLIWSISNFQSFFSSLANFFLNGSLIWHPQFLLGSVCVWCLLSVNRMCYTASSNW